MYVGQKISSRCVIKKRFYIQRILELVRVYFILQNNTNAIQISDFMYLMLWLTYINIFIRITDSNKSFTYSSMYNFSFYNICGCCIVDCVASNEHKELDYDSSSRFFNVLAMCRFFNIYKRKVQFNTCSDYTLLSNWVRIFMGHFDFNKVSTNAKVHYFSTFVSFLEAQFQH